MTSRVFPNGYTGRPATLDDVPAMHALLVAADRADGRTTAGTLADKQRNFDDPWCNPAVDSLLVFTPAGELAGFGRVFANPEPAEQARAFLVFEAHPGHRPYGVEEILLDWLEARGTARLRELAATRPGRRAVLRTGVEDTLTARVARVQAHGFQIVRYFYRMRRDLSQPMPDRPAPEGVRLCSWRPDLDRAAWQVFNESFSDHWGHEFAPYADWQQFFVGQSTFSPGLTRLAVAGDDVVGISINRLSPEDNARSGRDEATIGQLGVRRAWRKRGVASALLVDSMRAFQAAGLRYATLGVDSENTTNALQLYEGLGFVPVIRSIVFEKECGEDRN
jgi:mycothiol synthase